MLSISRLRLCLQIAGVLSAAVGTLAVERRVGPTDLVAASWFAGFHATEGFPLKDVSWNKYTHITYSFAVTTPDVTNITLNGSDGELVPKFVRMAHAHGVKALVSIGGWTGARFYSSNVATAANRTAFVNTVTEFALEYDLDGIDFDWEYPGDQGIGCNVVSLSDTGNFLLFLQELRADPVGSKLFLTAATPVTPWVDATGSPSTDVSGFAKVLDYIAIMNYDIWGPWSPTVGANAPLNDSCTPAADQVGSAVSAVISWHAAGMPFDQIVLGVPGYGHSFRVNSSSAFEPGSTTALAAWNTFDATNQPPGDAWDDTAGYDVCGNFENWGGDFDFWGMVEGGFLTTTGTVAKGIYYRYDECSQTPYVYDATSQVMISYDNAESFAAKGNFVKSSKLRGFAMWETGGDYKDILLDSIRAAAGF